MIDPLIQFANRTREATSTTGTGDTITLTGAVAGFKAFPETDGAIYLFEILNTNGSWQIYRGAWSTGGTLDRSSGPVDSWDGSGTNFSVSAGAEVLCVADAAWFRDVQGSAVGYATLTELGSYYIRTDQIVIEAVTGDTTSPAATIYSLAEGVANEMSMFSGKLIARQYGGAIGPPGSMGTWDITGYISITQSIPIHNSRVDISAIHVDTDLSSAAVIDSSSSGIMEISVIGITGRDIHWLLIGHLSSMIQQ